MNDARLAAHLAQEAGRLLMQLRSRGTHAGKALGIEGDRIANAWLMAQLKIHRPDDAVLCEEEKDDFHRLGKARLWIIDPLDGTREYGEGRDDWAVHVALAIEGEARVGAVALPARGLVLASDIPAARQPLGTPPRMLVSRTRPAQEALTVADALGAELLPMGSAGAKAMAVVLGEADIYLHSGGQYAWDNAAPVAVACAAGLAVSRIDGSAMRYNERDTYVPDLMICHPDIAGQVRSLLDGS